MRVAARVFLGFIGLGALAVVAVLVPVPGPSQLRAWAEGLGGVGVLVFLGAYAVLTVAPIPRTVFNLAAGLLFGEVIGVSVAILATAVSGALGFLLARAIGRDVVPRHGHRRGIRTVNERLSSGGALAVASLRLMPVVPFAPLSYLCGVSSLRPRPYLVGTVVGSVPGTIAVVVLGDALTATTPPALVACYGAFAAAGAAGLVYATRSVNATDRTETVAREADSRRE